MKETERRKRFFQTALQLIREGGFKAMTIQKLADALQCDRSNIYNYVKSKQELLDTLLFEISDKFHQGMSDIEQSSCSPIEKLKAVITMHVRLTVEHPYQVNLLVNDWRFLKETRQQEFVDFRTTYEKKLTTIIQAGIQAGDFKNTNTEFMVNCILSSIRWLYTWYTPSQQNVNPIELERQMVDFIFNGISKK